MAISWSSMLILDMKKNSGIIIFLHVYVWGVVCVCGVHMCACVCPQR